MYIHTLSRSIEHMQAAKALANLHICTGSPEPSLHYNAISTKLSCAGLYKFIYCLFILNSVLSHIFRFMHVTVNDY